MRSWIIRTSLGYGRSSGVMSSIWEYRVAALFNLVNKTSGVPRLVGQAPDITS